MNKRKLIIDTDPGIDDAIAIAIALFSDKIDVELITTVAGNVSLDLVTENTLKLLTFFEKSIPVAKGLKEPLLEKFDDAKNVHGASGMDGYDFGEPCRSNLLKEHAVEAMRRTILQSETPITIMAIGPLTNIAVLLKMYPEVKANIDEIVFMGGSLTRGNKTVMGEFNIATDPQAAKIVFMSGVKLVMAGLDMGLKALVYPEDSEEIKIFGKTGHMMYSLFQKYRGGSFKTGLKMYDSCAIAYILCPEMYEITETFIDVETQSNLTMGCTIVDLKGYLGKAPNAKVCTDINPNIFKEWFMSSIKNCI
ncbi:ribonucleoside hydrolase RihC [Clostridium algidicarnis]|uniref:ribonucleoside hydrolase RihC n=1 Tax=Clostridium algidicarnis TaxID=37659 RepID=UPI001C0BA61A|nr:ribonucleoside hydrolase RihC [Clostridium algidicarnis]MBU3192445.1 ribonucleoside hydrolase RihC [Clostridium algidicarnis]MBU3206465.1 ribonucleoside hydrolase RihC [Clostridium algidicarnis]